MLEASDPLGLVRRFRLRGDADFVTVLPRRVTIDASWPLGRSPIHETPRRRSLAEDTTRFLGIREYRNRLKW